MNKPLIIDGYDLVELERFKNDATILCKLAYSYRSNFDDESAKVFIDHFYYVLAEIMLLQEKIILDKR